MISLFRQLAARIFAAVAVTAALAWLIQGLGAFAVDGLVGRVVHAITETGGVRLVPAVLALALFAWLIDGATASATRRRDSVVAFVLLALVLPAMAYLIESAVKPAVAIPRPSHVRLRDAGVIDDLDAFYALNKSARREVLTQRVAATGREAVAGELGIDPVLLEHWLHEAGSTFPSAHAFNAFAAATFFLAGSLVSATASRRIVSAGLVTWAAAVSVSRVALLVHRPDDVLFGAAAGALVGMLAVFVWIAATGRR